MTRIVRALPLGVLLLSAASAARAAGPVELRCKVYGVTAGEKFEYRTVVEAVWPFDPVSVQAKPVGAGGGCTEVGRKSRLFGKKGGTRLQFGAWKCRDDDAYYTAKVIFNGLPVVQHIERGNTRTVFNEDGGMASRGPEVFVEPGGEMPANAPLSVPEGKFRFLYLDCSVR